MSDDPERLLGEPGGGHDPLVRALLASVQRVDPPAGSRDKAWRAIAVRLAAAAAAGAAASSSTAAAKAGVGWLAPGTLAGKAAFTVAAGAIAVGGYLAAQHALPARAPDAAAADRRAASSIAAPARTPTAQHAEETQPTPERPEEAAPGRSAESSPPDRLRAESALLAEARAQLRAGHAERAQLALGRLQARFPDGVLVQEREVLTIEVLAARGDAQAARRRARAFVEAHPKSPHSAKLRGFLAPGGLTPALRGGAKSVP